MLFEKQEKVKDWNSGRKGKKEFVYVRLNQKSKHREGPDLKVHAKLYKVRGDVNYAECEGKL